MILYLDTSSLVKLYVEEHGSDLVQDWAEQADAVTTSRVAYPEAMAAFARRLRERSLTQSGFGRASHAFSKEWRNYAVLDMEEVAAGRLAVKHGLRGFDAIHLEAALAVRRKAGKSKVAFSSFDSALNTAASKEGLFVLSGITKPHDM